MTSAFSGQSSAAATRAERSTQGHAQPWVEVQDRALVGRARNGDSVAMDQLIERYRGFVRMKASAYFLAGGEGEDLVQEGLI
ncbi:MAG TPA: hypothetical protein VHK23_10175, partial [Miltoncostaeaceae bacterium]|nr:hypothetical protein [Miltoncostaeaceae bacterium]